MSPTLRANSPGWSRLSTNGNIPSRGRRPKVGLRPKTPQRPAGTLTEPLVSEPRASGTRPAATAAADPPDEPPAMRARSCGLWVAP